MDTNCFLTFKSLIPEKNTLITSTYNNNITSISLKHMAIRSKALKNFNYIFGQVRGRRAVLLREATKKMTARSAPWLTDGSSVRFSPGHNSQAI